MRAGSTPSDPIQAGTRTGKAGSSNATQEHASIRSAPARRPPACLGSASAGRIADKPASCHAQWQRRHRRHNVGVRVLDRGYWDILYSILTAIMFEERETGHEIVTES